MNESPSQQVEINAHQFISLKRGQVSNYSDSKSAIIAQLNTAGVWSLRTFIAYGHRIRSSHTVIAYGHRIRSSLFIFTPLMNTG